MNSKFELIAGELRATLLGNHSGISNGEPTGVEGAGVSGGRKRARLRCPWAADRAQTNFARNFPRSFFETARKRCNSNDMNSKFELIAGELRATFLGNHDVAASKVIEGKQEDVRGGSGSYLPRARLRCPWAVVGPGRDTGPTGVEGAGGTGGPGCGARGRWQGLAGLRDDAPSKARGADGSRAGRRPRAHQAARPSKVPAGKARTSSPWVPCARGGAFRPCRSGSGRRYAAPRLRRR